MTQEGLAELANAQVERNTGTPGAMDADYISKLERGLHTWPNKHYRRALREVTGASTDIDLGFYSTRNKAATVARDPSVVTQGSDDVRRQAFLRALTATVAGVAAGSPVAEAVGRAATGDAPARVGATDVRQVDHAITLFGEWQDLYGGGVCRDALAGQVRWATQLLNARATDQVRNDLHRSVGFLADVAGWGAFDAGHHDTARQYFRLALHCAEQAGDWGLRANVLSDMARQEVYLGRPDDGLSLIELAQVRQDRQTPTVRAMLSTVRARTLAKVNRGEDCYAAVLTAEDHFSSQKPSEDPPWITYFNAADLAGDTGHALLDVALAGRHVDDARRRLRQSVAGYSAAQARARAFSLGKLAVLELTVGDAGQGIAYAEQALDAGAPLKSRRAHDDLVEVRKALGRHPNLPGASDLRSRFTEAISAWAA
ncbi:XRE family transcriptional regulator [Goodfellowiella coeruleoviolacea]|uniref:XRE family transcriptional regulator n=1 Tax=Goodfellowiella coeruleoviolacea TaxID=334858 RepID=UPI0020A2DDB8|nr:XRE family transcriptional regulator [Goodfellowiella coeruleoviolacea]